MLMQAEGRVSKPLPRFMMPGGALLGQLALRTAAELQLAFQASADHSRACSTGLVPAMGFTTAAMASVPGFHPGSLQILQQAVAFMAGVWTHSAAEVSTTSMW